MGGGPGSDELVLQKLKEELKQYKFAKEEELQELRGIAEKLKEKETDCDALIESKNQLEEELAMIKATIETFGTENVAEKLKDKHTQNLDLVQDIAVLKLQLATIKRQLNQNDDQIESLQNVMKTITESGYLNESWQNEIAIVLIQYKPKNVMDPTAINNNKLLTELILCLPEGPTGKLSDPIMVVCFEIRSILAFK
ncbi:hypothetical protein GIB67_008030 [Kingdonia uniflora]|uniref:Uncharacterized protein n=1 Tax=Kingdonia uniflora TaxID=39325 RepID=A0A7J7MN90_9MAGN|nr:hypothetical protein GIB67_008030 [Kingdonia uniflora]